MLKLSRQNKMTSEQYRLGYIAGWLSIALNTALFGLKYWCGIQANSIAMTADSWHTLSDSFTSLIVIIGFWLGSKPADEKHPFGHGRAEGIAAVIIATLLVVVALDFIVVSFDRALNPVTVNYTTFIISVFAVSIIIKEGMAQIAIRVGNKLNSEALKADGWHHRSDAIAALVIVIGAFLGNSFWWLDTVLGFFVSCLILYAAFDIFKSSIVSLIGTKPKIELIEDINSTIAKLDDRIRDIHNHKMHSYGDIQELSVHIRLPKLLTVDESHAITKTIERALLRDKNITATIHVEPVP